MKPINNNKEELHIVTEQGTFGNLNIEDPSKKKVLSQAEIEALIESTTVANLNIGK
jgi:hypothetical protein